MPQLIKCQDDKIPNEKISSWWNNTLAKCHADKEGQDDIKLSW